MQDFPLLPDSASTVSGELDMLFFAMVVLSIVFGLGVTLSIGFFSIRYRQGSNANRDNPSTGSTALELTWSIIPLILGLGIFVWGADLYFTMARPPQDAIEVYAVGKQWMWKFQHPDGQREINELHVPVNHPIKLEMISQDVIHSFFVPAFRIKQDVLPGRYTTTWFEATKTGEFHLFCAEYCGLDHAVMGGKVIVMAQADYERWLSEGNEGSNSTITIGQQLFEQQGCVGCHQIDGSGVGPSVEGIFGETIELEDGTSVVADEQYIRTSILLPNQDIVAGYSGIMPTYEGRLSEEDVLQLIAYIKSLGSTTSEGP